MTPSRCSGRGRVGGAQALSVTQLAEISRTSLRGDHRDRNSQRSQHFEPSETSSPEANNPCSEVAPLDAHICDRLSLSLPVQLNPVLSLTEELAL
jgi:hypothetical protein